MKGFLLFIRQQGVVGLAVVWRGGGEGCGILGGDIMKIYPIR